MATRIGINGFGRIGRALARLVCGSGDIVLAAVNDLAPAEALARRLSRDSIYGHFPGVGATAQGSITVDGREIRCHRVQDPAEIPWRESGAEIIVEATGRFLRRAEAARHLRAGGTGRVIITAAAPDADAVLFPGLNDAAADLRPLAVLSAASCTAQAAAPVLAVLREACGLGDAALTTMHAYTNQQPALDAAGSDSRHSRAAALSMIPTTTTAVPPLEGLFPELAGRLQGLSVRVPVPAVSLLELVVRTRRPIETGPLRAAFEKAAAGPLAPLLGATGEELVSSDFRGEPRSAVVDLPGTRTVAPGLVRVVAWYDNEWGYANRLADLIRLLQGNDR